MTLIGRRTECGMLDQLVAAIRAGESRVLVVSGEPGVGKTAIAEGLAQRVIKGDIPEPLRDRRVITLDLA